MHRYVLHQKKHRIYNILKKGYDNENINHRWYAQHVISFPTQKLNSDSTHVLAQIEQIRLGLVNGNNIDTYVKPEINEAKMYMIRENEDKEKAEKVKKKETKQRNKKTNEKINHIKRNKKL